MQTISLIKFKWLELNCMETFNYFCATKAGFNDPLNCNLIVGYLKNVSKIKSRILSQDVGGGPIKSFKVFH